MSREDSSADALQRSAQRTPNAPQLKTSHGQPVDTITASMTAGERGPILLQDYTFIDHMAHFDRERIPERVVHAKGSGAFGYLEITDPTIQRFSKAKIFSSVGKRTPLALRFSTVGGESGSADTVRDPRGTAIKFYTEDGIWDLVGNNTPIFFIRDPILFPSFIHTQKRNPETHLPDADMFWDFVGHRPETVHQMSFLFGPRGIPDGYRHMNLYGSHTFALTNERGERTWCKFHFKTDQGIRNLDPAEAGELAGSDPNYSQRDLYNAIQGGEFPSWTMYVQTMSEAQAAQCAFNPFDLTKVWPHGEYPLQEVGRLVLNRNPRNYFAEVEQIAFAPANMPPGIEPSPDKMLQGRLFSYPDTHRHRLGANYAQIPVNRATNGVTNNYQRDGPMCVTDNGGGAAHYFPNSFQGPQPDAAAQQAPLPVAGAAARYESGAEDNFAQAGNFYRNVLSAAEKTALVNEIAGHMSAAQPHIRQRAIANFAQADAEYGRRIAERIAEIERTAPAARPKKAAAPLNPPRDVPRPRL